MALVALRFCVPLSATPGRADLAFRGGDPCQPSLPSLTAEIHLLTATRVTLDSDLALLGTAISATYDHAVWRGVGILHGDPWQQAGPDPVTAQAPHADSLRTRIQDAIPWGSATPRPTAIAATHADLDRALRPVQVTPWESAQDIAARVRADFAELDRRQRPSGHATWLIAAHADDAGRGVAWVQLLPLPRPILASVWAEARATGRAYPARHQVARRTWHDRAAPWQIGAAVYGWGGPWVPPVIPPPEPWRCYTPPSGLAVVLDLADDLQADRLNLALACTRLHAPRIIPIRRAYIVLNTVTLHRVSDNLALPALSLSLSIDSSSWVWGFSADLPGDALDEVTGGAGQPVELEARVNGTVFRLLAERVTRSRQFGKSRVKISGRGPAAVLDAPYSPIMSLASANPITAQQAALDAITRPGLPTGWALDWQLTDWLLPAGLWAHQGSPLSAVQRIAQAAGGYIQADPHTQTLHILHRYPVAPWDWVSTAPGIEIPAAVAISEGIEWADKPAYEAVYVSGQAGGILAHVRRTGTAGALMAQMVTDDLITHPDAGRQRGLSLLADTGRQARQSLSLPVLPESGIILPGTLARFVDGATPRIGLVRAVSIQANQPSLRQTLEIETHA